MKKKIKLKRENNQRKEEGREKWSASQVVLSLLQFYFFFFFCLFAFSRTTHAAYGGSQARGLIGAVDAGLRQSPSNAGSEPRLRPTPQLMATPDP